MRSIEICEKCPHFVPYYLSGAKLFGVSKMHEKLQKAKSSVDMDGRPCVIRRLHSCTLDDFGVMYAHYNPKVEYFNLKLLESCPYYAEQYLYEMYKCEHKKVDYSVFRHFKKTRVCQHCGATIPNKDECPKCGYTRFEIYTGLDEGALLKNICIIVVLVIFLLVFQHIGAEAK